MTIAGYIELSDALIRIEQRDRHALVHARFHQMSTSRDLHWLLVVEHHAGHLNRIDSQTWNIKFSIWVGI